MNVRVPVWRKSTAEPKFAQKYWFAVLVGAASIVAGLFYRYASQIPDKWLFYLKIASFSVTAFLGVIGVITDFKDEHKRLTKAGKLNLFGLIFAAVIGVVTQRAENIRADNSGREAEILRLRSLEPISDTVFVDYESVISLEERLYEEKRPKGSFKGPASKLLRKLQERAKQFKNVQSDAHTEISLDRNGNLVRVTFDEESSFAKGIVNYPVVVGLYFSKHTPQFGSQCSSKPDLGYSLDGNQLRGLSERYRGLHSLYFEYLVDPPQLSTTLRNVQLRLDQVAQSRELSSVLDLSGAYVQLIGDWQWLDGKYYFAIRSGTRQLDVNVV